VVLSPEEVMRFLTCIENLNTEHPESAYAAGLRVSEATHLKVIDVDASA